MTCASRKEVFSVLDSILSTSTSSIDPTALLLCTLASLAVGVGAALVYMYNNQYNRRFVITLALLPAIVQMVIMLVNGNLGTGVAVMGAFSLIRSRSVPGNARDIGAIFLAMALGLATGTGYIVVALIFLVIIGGASIALDRFGFGRSRRVRNELKITIPEDLDYAGLFDDLMSAYTTSCELVRVRTTNMGALYELQYLVTLRDPLRQKAFLDELRCRNGNLNISLGRVTVHADEL